MRFGGKCPSCGQGVAIEAPQGKPTACPACGTSVTLKKVTGTYSQGHLCDPACLYARKADCVCVCAGENHFLGWQVDLTSGQYAQPLSERIVAKVAKSQAQIKARAAAKQEAAEKALNDQRSAFAAQYPDVVEALSSLTEDSNYFLADLAGTLARKGSLSPRAVEIARKIVAEDAERLARLAAQPKAAPVVTGKIVVTGEVLVTKWQDSGFAYNSGSMKMLVLDDRGFKVWGTLPRSLDASKGDRVTFTATVTASDDDEAFGYFSRPTRAAVLEGVSA